jgi:hypothetical protein
MRMLLNRISPLRVGGLLLAAGSFALIPIILEYVFIVGPPIGTGPGGSITLPDLAAHTLSHWDTLSRGWRFEVIAIASLATAALILMGRPGNGRTGWAAVAVGSLILCPMYALMLGGYRSILNSPELDLTLYDTFRGSATACFHCGIAVLRLGLAFVFLMELATRCTKFWRGFFMLGCATNLLHGVSFIALFWGASIPLLYLSPFGILGFICAGTLGVRLIKHPLPDDR